MFKIVHISDIHVGRSATEDANTSVLVRHILDRFSPNTVVVVTGDFVQRGLSGQHRRVADLLLQPLRERFTVLSCPGNHDYSLNWLGSKLSDDSVAAYREFVDDVPFPHIHVVEDERTVFIGLDSADPQDRVWLCGGLIDGRQVERLKGLLTEHEGRLRVVYFHHHPFMWRFWMVMVGTSALLRALASHGAGLVLFGHKHWSQEFRGTKGVPLMLSSGKSTVPRWFQKELSFRVVEVDAGRIASVYRETVPKS